MLSCLPDGLEAGAMVSQSSPSGDSAVRSAFAEWLTQSRKERGISQSEIAEMAGVTQEYVAMLERGSRKPSRSVVGRLAPPLTPRGADAYALLRAGMRAAGFDPPPAPPRETAPPLPERVADLPPDLQEALRYILELRPEIRDYMLKLWTEQARPHLEMQADLERRRAQMEREIEEMERVNRR